MPNVGKNNSKFYLSLNETWTTQDSLTSPQRRFLHPLGEISQII